MIPDPNVLERNLERLFARAYRPVRPSAAFRARLLHALERRFAAPAARQPAVTWRIAAAVVLGLGGAFLAWRLLQRPAAAVGVDDLLASGRAAVLEGDSGAWRPLSDAEVRAGVELAGSSLDLATPAGASVQVVLGQAGRLAAEAESWVSLEAPAEGALSVALWRGAIALERRTAGETWRIRTSEGSILFEHGALEVACLGATGAREVRARLREGAAAVDVDPRREIGVGAEVLLRGGRLIAGHDLDPSSAGLAQRTDAAAGEAEPLPPASAAANTPETSSVQGTIAVPSGTEPPDRFDVTLLRRERLPEVSQPQAKSFAAADGAFAFDGLKPGAYAIFVHAPGFAVSVSRDVELRAGPTPIEIAVLLDRGIAVSGRVLDAEGRPVEGAIVLSEDDAPAQVLPLALHAPSEGGASVATSGPDGSFELLHLRRARHHLRATRGGHGAGWSQPVDASTDPSPGAVEIRLTRPGSVEGRVRHDDGSPWPAAIVIASLLDTSFEHPCVSYGMAVADAEGGYRIADLPPGLYVVLNVLESGATAGLASPRVVQARIEPGALARVDLPAESLGTTLEGILAGPDGKPLAGLDVMVVPREKQMADWKAGRSGADGSFTFPDLLPGTYHVFVGQELGARFTLQGELEVPAVPTFRRTLTVSAGILRGRITDARSGAGLAGSVVIVELVEGGEHRIAGKTRADGAGEYTVEWLPAGRYRTTAYALTGRYGQETADEVWIRGDEAETVSDFALAPGAELLVLVVDASGAPVAAADVQLVGGGGAAVSFNPDDVTDSSGLLRVRGLKPGRWTVRASCERFRPAETAVDLLAGDEREVRIVLPSSD